MVARAIGTMSRVNLMPACRKTWANISKDDCYGKSCYLHCFEDALKLFQRHSKQIYRCRFLLFSLRRIFQTEVSEW